MIKASPAELQYHRSRAKLETMLAGQSPCDTAARSHLALAQIHLARSRFIDAMMSGEDHPAPTYARLIDKEA